MAKSGNQKGKILYLEKILRETGEDHVVTMQEILAVLMENGVSAERKSIYDDIEVLRAFGMDVRFRRGKTGGYYLAGHTGAGKQKNPDAEQEIKERSEETPQAEIKRAEKRDPGMKKSSQEEPPEGTETVWKPVYHTPGENGRQIKLLCGNSIRKDTEAYFGKKAQYKEKGTGYFTVTVQVAEDPQFYGWLTAMGHEARIAKPRKAALAYREYLKALAREYKGI